jgi:uncharacterized protein YecA (UPF0149 family)
VWFPPLLVITGEAGFRIKGFANAGRNDPCPCHSGMKFKKCYGGNVTA